MIKWASANEMPEVMMQVYDLVPAVGQQLVAHPTHILGGGELVLSKQELRSLWAVPCCYEDFPETEGICMTGNTQLKWIGQCVQSDVR